MIRSPGLRPGARVALIAGAGPLTAEGVDRAEARVRSFGWEPVTGAHARVRRGYLAGSDEERLADLTAALAGDNDAIWFLRGGYGTMRILPRVDWAPLVDRPRPLVGFSDNTAFHLAALRYGVVTFHGPHPASAGLGAFGETCLRRLLEDPAPAGLLPFPGDGGRAETIAGGVAEGLLTGGNLSLVAALCGTPWQAKAKGAILFLEEVGEAGYRVDRLLTQLRMSGVLDGVAGIALGAFTEVGDEGKPGLPTMAEVLADRLGDLGVPVALGFPFGHVDESWTLPMGVRARMDAGAGTLEVLEPAVGGGG